MKPRLLLLLVVATLLTCAGQAQTPFPRRLRFTEQEKRQGFSNRTLLAKPHGEGAAVTQEIFAAETREGRRVQRSFPRLGNLHVIEVATGEKIEDAIGRLRSSGRYEYVELDRIKQRHGAPNDPRFAAGEQWGLRNTGQESGIAAADIGAVAAWDIRTDASDVIVAVIDTGVRVTHEDLVGNLWINPGEIAGNGIDDDKNGYVDDVHGINSLAAINSPGSGNPVDDAGHGTSVAGVIGAVGNNGKGLAGVAWKIKIMALKFDDAEGSASASNEMECIDYALANGARIINISYGSFFFSQSEYDAIKRARDAGAVVVTSAGNDSLNIDLYPSYPANYLLDNIVAVAATDRRDALSSFSSYGVGLVEIAAPGTDIATTGHESNTAYVVHDGTSFSAPMVAGALALIKAQFPTANYRGLINRALRAVDPLPALAGRVQTGGRLNLLKALTQTSDAPFNDSFAARAILTGENLALRTHTANASGETGEPAHAGSPAAGTLWWSWTAPRTGTAAVETTGSSFDTVVGVYSGTALASLTEVASNDNVTGAVTSRISFPAVAGSTYQIAVGGKSGATGAALVTLGYLPANDNFAQATLLTGPSMRSSGFNTMAGSEANEPKATTSARDRTVWYRWVAPRSTYYSFSIFAYGFDAVSAVYTGTSLGTLTKVETASTHIANEAGLFDSVAGQIYYFQVDSADGNAGFFDLTITDAVPFPTFFPANPSPAFSPTTDILYFADTFGLITSINFTSFDFDSNELSGTLDVHSPAIGSDGSLYIGDEYGYFYGYTPGFARRWRNDLGLTRVTSSPAIGADGAVYVHSDDGYLQGYFPDGTLKWRASVPGESYSSASIGGDGTLYIGSADEHLYALSPLDGALKWKFKADGEIYASPAIDAAGSIYFGTLNGKFYALNADGTQRWIYSAEGSISSSAAIGTDGTLYFGSYDTHLYALTSAGSLRWKYATGDEIRASSPAVASDGTIYIGSYDGFIHAVTAAGGRRRVYATGTYIRSSPLIHEQTLIIGSGDSRVYLIDVGADLANSPWPMHRQNIRRTGRRTTTAAPTVITQSVSQSVAAGARTTLAVNVSGSESPAFQWNLNGVPIPGATQSSYTIGTITPGQAGEYTVTVSNGLGSVTSSAMIVGVASTTKLIGPGRELGTDIKHPVTLNTYDQILLEGAAATVRADPDQVMRISYLDANDDIVQVEFSGAGSFSLVLDGATGPTPPAKYNQPTVSYMKGRANLVVTGANESTHLTVFSVGRNNAVNQALFRDVSYDGVADIGLIAISSANGRFGSLRTANARYGSITGRTGIHAPGIAFEGPVFVGDIAASGTATPVFQIGSSPDVRVTGGSLLQPNARAVQVGGIAQLKFTAGGTSHGDALPAQTNRARLEQDGTDVTAQIVVNPTP